MNANYFIKLADEEKLHVNFVINLEIYILIQFLCWKCFLGELIFEVVKICVNHSKAVINFQAIAACQQECDKTDVNLPVAMWKGHLREEPWILRASCHLGTYYQVLNYCFEIVRFSSTWFVFWLKTKYITVALLRKNVPWLFKMSLYNKMRFNEIPVQSSLTLSGMAWKDQRCCEWVIVPAGWKTALPDCRPNTQYVTNTVRPAGWIDSPARL